MRSSILLLISISSLSAALSSSATCKLPISSVPYTSGIPSWQSDDYTCQGPPDVFVVRSSPGKGLGVFALRDLEIGDIVMRETPALKIDPPDYVRGTGYPMDKVAKLVRKEFEALSREEQEDIMSLTYHATPDEEATMDKLGIIFRTNAYNTDQQIGLFPKIARINHSCRPNTSYYWNSKLNKRVVYANRNIKKGEEFSVSYIGLLSGHQDRQGSLNRYGFQCSCEACAQHGSAKQLSDKRRVDIHRGFAEFEPKLTLAIPQSKSARQQAVKNAQRSIELAELVESEGLADYYAKVYRIVAISHARVKEWKAATIWANKGYQLKYMEDPESPYTIEMHQLAGTFIQEWENEMRNKSG